MICTPKDNTNASMEVERGLSGCKHWGLRKVASGGKTKTRRDKMKDRRERLGAAVLASVFAVVSAHASITPYSENFDSNNSTNGWYLFTGTTTGQAIGRLNGAGPRYDWADNDDGVAQSALSTGDPLPAGGTITGDGNLADGGLQWTVGDTTKGNERIAYNLGGTIEEGEELTFTFNLYNNRNYYNEVNGYFYDLTTGTQLVGDEWVITKATSDPVYTPVDKVRTYTGTAGTAGHQIAIVFREWHSSTARVAYIDNISVTSSIPEPATLGLFGLFGAAVVFVRKRLAI